MPIPAKNTRKEIQFHIIDITAQYYGIEPETLTTKIKNGNDQEFIHKKYICYYLLKDFTFLSCGSIGKFFATTHSTVWHGVNKIDGLLKYNRRTIDEISELKKMINNFKSELHKTA